MRSINNHVINPMNDKLEVVTTDEPGSGGANHEYEVRYDGGNTGWTQKISFQNGPIAEADTLRRRYALAAPSHARSDASGS